MALAMSPLLWRRRGRARRLGAETGALPAWRELTDTAWDFGVTPVVSETPRQAAQRIVRVRGLEGESAAAVHRVADAVEYELYAPGGAGASGTSRSCGPGPPVAGSAETSACSHNVSMYSSGTDSSRGW